MGQTTDMTAAKRLPIPRGSDAAAIARRWIEQETDDQLSDATLNSLKLVATELINNAYLHGRGEIELVIQPRDGGTRVEVIDEGQGAAIKIQADGTGDSGGWGLRIVEQLSTSWGAHEGTTHVWAELPIS